MNIMNIKTAVAACLLATSMSANAAMIAPNPYADAFAHIIFPHTTTAPDPVRVFDLPEPHSQPLHDFINVIGTHHDVVITGGDDRGIVNPTSPVPVPAAVWLFMSGLIGLVGISRRKVAE